MTKTDYLKIIKELILPYEHYFKIINDDVYINENIINILVRSEYNLVRVRSNFISYSQYSKTVQIDTIICKAIKFSKNEKRLYRITNEKRLFCYSTKTKGIEYVKKSDIKKSIQKVANILDKVVPIIHEENKEKLISNILSI